MSFAPWSPDYETGHPDLDQQHKRLFGMVNDLHEAMARRHGREMLGPVLENLAAYTIEHFAMEESLMVATGYPEQERHARAHAALADQVSTFRQRYAAGYLTLPSTLARFLADWLRHHIREEDMALIAWLRERDS